jgi:hypothetical protein
MKDDMTLYGEILLPDELHVVSLVGFHQTR